MIEIRTADSSKIDTLLELLEEFEMKIGLGSECCVHKLPTLEQVETVASITDDMTVITPITPQKHFDRIMEYVNGLPATVRLVVNDVGVLYSLHENGMLERFCPVVAGRGIVHTSEACPWVDHLLRDETKIIKQAFLQTNLNYSRTLNFFKGLGISGMETDMAPRTVKAAVSTGLPVAAHAEYIAVSYARSCHTARFYNEQPPECTLRCNSPIELELVDMFDLSGIPPGFAQPSQEMLDIFPILYLLGNTIFMRSDCHDTRELERVIINGDMYDSMGLKNTILSFIER